MRLLDRLSPGVVVLDLAMRGLPGLEAVRRAAKSSARPRVLVLAPYADPDSVRQAFAAGARGYLPTSAERRELESAIEALANGETWLSPSIAGVVLQDLTRPTRPEAATPAPSGRLTARQREVLALVAEGASTKEIAKRLAISVKTVETHRAQIMERLGIHHLAGLVRYAVRTGLVAPDA
jgi:DNA-binding NarL/FixJ family response regulator